MRRAITMGLALAGCPDAATTSESNGGLHNGGSSTTGTTSETSSSTFATSDGPVQYDLGVSEDVGGPRPFDCEDVPQFEETCEVVWGTVPELAMACEKATGGEPCRAADTAEVSALLVECMQESAGLCSAMFTTCGPVDDGRLNCCYWAKLDGFICPGPDPRGGR